MSRANCVAVVMCRMWELGLPCPFCLSHIYAADRGELIAMSAAIAWKFRMRQRYERTN